MMAFTPAIPVSLRAVALLLLLHTASALAGLAQTSADQVPPEQLEAQCAALLGPEMIPDGQEFYRSLPIGTRAECNLTFYAGLRYRLAFSVSQPAVAIAYTLYDNDRKVLFESSGYGNPAWWDVRFDATSTCTLSLSLISRGRAVAGVRYAMLRVGFCPPTRKDAL